jgi:acyl carrier protein
MENLRNKIVNTFSEVADIRGLKIISLSDDVVLLESGLDSLGFAILVAKLEEDLGYDPFALNDDPVYPRTFEEFVYFYQKFAPK